MNAEAVEQLIQHTVCAARSAEIGARELATVGYGAARSGRGKLLSVLFAALARAA